MNSNRFSTLPLVELILATFFWGWGFIATKWALQETHFSLIVFLRFFLAFILGLFFTKISFKSSDFKISVGPGIFLGLTLVLQTAGMNSTTATQSAFITTLYALFVPLLMWIYLKQRPPLYFWIALLVALLGSALLVNWEKAFSFHSGEFLTLLNALTAAIQIVWIGQVANRIQSSFQFNTWNCLWTSLTVLPLCFFWTQKESISLLAHVKTWSPLTWASLLSLTLFSTFIAFTLQIRGQKKIPSHYVSLIFLLESPFAFLLAQHFLNESVTHLQLIGMYLILAALSSITYFESYFKKNKK